MNRFTIAIKSFVPGSIMDILRQYKLKKRFQNCVFHRGVSVSADSHLSDFVKIFSNTNIAIGATIGSYSYVQSGCSIWNADIGPFCSIARDVTIGLVGHPMHMVSTSPVFYDNQQPLPKFFTKRRVFSDCVSRTSIGPDVWIGDGVKIKAGVSIGVGSVIGAGAVVTKDIPPYSIAVGVPCRILRQRFDPHVCKRLADSRWWELDDARLAQLAHHFDDPLALLKALEA